MWSKETHWLFIDGIEFLWLGGTVIFVVVLIIKGLISKDK